MKNKGTHKLEASDKKHLDKFLRYLSDEALRFMGYPCSEVFDYAELLPLFQYPINNIGDPFTFSNYHLNSHHFEQEVLKYFKEITCAKEKIDKTWGYVTSGGTEGNLYGFYAARENLGKNAVVYYSQESHYSIVKNIKILGLNSQMVASQQNGEMDYLSLAQKIQSNAPKKVIISANIGTTMKGAIDNVEKIRQILKDLNCKNYYIHADAAFFGMILPFTLAKPAFGFDTGIDSIAISGHKMIGTPIPCGVCLIKEQYLPKLTTEVDYIGSLDNTISGSRNGISPMLLWYAIKTNSYQSFSQRVQSCFDNADYIIQRFQALGIHAWRNPHSFIVVFDKCAPKLLKKWQIAAHKNIAHLIPMPHINTRIIDGFFSDLEKTLKKNKSRIAVFK